MANCLRDGCEELAHSRGYCGRHYMAERRKGTFETHTPTLEERFWAKVEKTDACWPWRGSLTAYGYGTIWIENHRRAAHIVGWELTNGPVPEGLQLDHRCHDPKFCQLSRRCPHRRCVNPAHLEPVTARVNLLRGGGVSAANAAKTHCPQGHEYTAANTYHDPRTGNRQCVTCRQVTDRSKYVKRTTEMTVPCGTCGTPFSFVRKAGKSPRYCSTECREEAGRKASREHKSRLRESR